MKADRLLAIFVRNFAVGEHSLLQWYGLNGLYYYHVTYSLCLYLIDLRHIRFWALILYFVKNKIFAFFRKIFFIFRYS